MDHCCFLVIDAASVSVGSTSGSDDSDETGEDASENRSPSLGERLVPSILCDVGLDLPERAVASASSLRNVSSSRSNLRQISTPRQFRRIGDLLATKHFNVVSTPIPHADGEHEDQKYATPERAVVEHKDCRDFGQECVD